MITPRFIILLDRANDIERTAIQDVVKSTARGWWHHHANTWIVQGGGTAAEWRDRLKEVLFSGTSSILVFRLPEDSGKMGWAYFGQQKDKRCKWLKQNYKPAE